MRFDSGPEAFVRVNRNYVLTENILSENDCIALICADSPYTVSTNWTSSSVVQIQEQRRHQSCLVPDHACSSLDAIVRDEEIIMLQLQLQEPFWGYLYWLAYCRSHIGWSASITSAAWQWQWMASATSDTGNTSSKQQQAQRKQKYNKRKKRPVSSVDQCHPHRRKRTQRSSY